MKSILLTGCTGGLGSHLLRVLSSKEEVKLYLLIRKRLGINSYSRVRSILNRFFLDQSERLTKRLIILDGDIEIKNFGLSASVLKGVLKEVEEVYHSAALTGFNLSFDSVKRVNINGVENIISFCLACKKLRKLNYVSSTFILGNKNYILKESDFNVGQKFNNAYEESKFISEEIVRKMKNRIFINIFRPSVITGDYSTGEIENFKLLYEAVRLFSRGVVSVFPGDKNTRQNLVPVDKVAEAMHVLSVNVNDPRTYHLISPNSVNCYKLMINVAKYFNYKNPKWTTPDKFVFEDFSPVQRAIITPFSPYFNYKGLIDAKETYTTLNKFNFVFPEIDENYLIRIFKACERVGYIKVR